MENEIIKFKEAQIPKIEALVLQELERISTIGPFFYYTSQVKDIGWKVKLKSEIVDTKLRFTTDNNHVVGIDLFRCGFTALPESIGNLKSLRALNLNSNKLTVLPESIGNLEELEILDIGGNNITRLPETIGNLKSLQYLQLGGNKLDFLPESIGNLKSLQTLRISDNPLTNLPESIGNLVLLQTLEANNIMLTTTPPSLKNLQSLRYLNLGHNKLNKIAESMLTLQSLQILHLESNNIIDLPESISKLSSLKKLYLGKNMLKKLPESIGNLKTLKTLHLKYNYLANLPETIGNLAALEFLYLKANKLKNLPLSLGNLKSLQQIDLRFNNVISGLGPLEILEKDLNKNNIIRLKDPFFKVYNIIKKIKYNKENKKSDEPPISFHLLSDSTFMSQSTLLGPPPFGPPGPPGPPGPYESYDLRKIPPPNQKNSPVGPKFVVWELTLACNANCKHCASNAGPKRDKELSTRESFDLIEQLALAGVECIFLSGGEPTLREDFYEIAEKIESSNMVYGFVTNGLIDLDIDFLNDHTPFAIGVSIDGTEQTHNEIRRFPDAFNRTWATIHKLLEKNLPVSIVTAVTKYNYHDLKRIELDILHHKVGGWQLQMGIPEGRMDMSYAINEEEYYELCIFIAKERQDLEGIVNIVAADNLGYYGSIEGKLHVNPWKGCPAGADVVGITSDGNIKPCLSIMHPKAIAGNIRNNKFSEIWKNEEVFSFFRNNKRTEGLCAECNRANDCKGGCSATMIGFSNELKREFPYCVKRYEESKIKETQDRINTFKECQISQVEANILQEIEGITGYRFSNVSSVDWSTQMGFNVVDQKVIGLGLYNCELTELPESIGNLNSLITLELQANHLSTLPESITHLKSLKYLNLSYNQIKSLPESIGNLSSLKTLNLETNELMNIPKSIENLSSLESLFLRLNKLSILPESIGSISLLHEIDLGNNQLSKLPDSIGDLSSLETLNLESNHLLSLPDSLKKLIALKNLCLNSNYLNSLPGSLGNLKSLENLDLNYNHNIRTLPESIGNLKSLKELNLVNINITSLPESIGKLSSLKRLRLDHSQLTTLPESIGNLHSIRELILDYNPITKFPESIKVLENRLVRFSLVIPNWIPSHNIQNK